MELITRMEHKFSASFGGINYWALRRDDWEDFALLVV
jgi:hypothetical protein